MSRASIDIWVGILVALGLAALLFLALKVGNMTGNSLGDSYRLSAEFDNIGGLKVRAPVKSAGVLIGRVSEINFDTNAYRAVVGMQIDRRYQFPKDTIATINTAGLLGEQYIGMDAGGDTDLLKPNDTVKKTQSAVVLEKLIGQFLYGKAQEGGK